MKSLKRYLLILVSVVLLIPIYNSCKKGPEDPAFSIYSRKHRLCQDWDFSYYKKVVQHNDVVFYYEFDGSSLKKIESGGVTVSAATMNLSFKNDGGYLWEQTITTDTSYYTYSEEGHWYFTGGGKDSDTKYKELVALQKTKVTETLQSDGHTNTTTYFGSGDLDAMVFKIIELSSKEVKLKSELQTNSVQSNPDQSDLQVLTILITLTKSS